MGSQILHFQRAPSQCPDAALRYLSSKNFEEFLDHNDWSNSKRTWHLGFTEKERGQGTHEGGKA